MYVVVSSAPGLRGSICPRLVTEVILDLLYPQVAPASSSPPLSTATAGSQAVFWVQSPGQPAVPVNLQVLASVTPNLAPPDSRWSAWSQTDRTIGVGYLIGTVTLASPEAFRQIGH